MCTSMIEAKACSDVFRQPCISFFTYLLVMFLQPTYSNVTACQLLSNLCVMLLYQRGSAAAPTACDLYFRKGVPQGPSFSENWYAVVFKRVELQCSDIRQLVKRVIGVVVRVSYDFIVGWKFRNYNLR